MDRGSVLDKERVAAETPETGEIENLNALGTLVNERTDMAGVGMIPNNKDSSEPVRACADR